MNRLLLKRQLGSDTIKTVKGKGHMVDDNRLAVIQKAIEIVETRRLGGIDAAIKLVGEEIALAILIANLRIDFGSRKHPDNPMMKDSVLAILRVNGLTN